MGTQANTTDLVIKKIGASGQISLGKEFAGRQVEIQQIDDGRWVITEVEIIPKHERIFHTPQAKASLARAEAWIAKNPVPKAATTADIDQLEKELLGGKEQGEKPAAKRRAGHKQPGVSRRAVRAAAG